MEISTITTEAPRMKAVAPAAKLNVPRYGDLLKRFAPKVIETVEENRLALRIVERRMSIGDGTRTAEENALLSLPATLAEQLEKKTYPAASAEPKDILRDLKAAGLRIRHPLREKSDRQGTGKASVRHFASRVHLTRWRSISRPDHRSTRCKSRSDP